ncbi:MAG: tetratricopeptide repeat protein [Chloroflexaceae bacterium]|nr:tetratricopeptide repeat protein [Chloroflexaceae bacterium]
MVLHHMLSGVSTTDALVQQAAVLRKVGTTYEQQGLYEQALSTYHQARRTTTVTGAAGHLEHARILSDIGWTAFRQNNLSDAQHFLEQALHYLHGSNNYVEQARVFNRLGGIAYTRGDTVAAHYYVEQNLHASQETNDLVGQFHAFANLSNMAAQKGNTEKSLLYGLQALDICVRIGNHHCSVELLIISVLHCTKLSATPKLHTTLKRRSAMPEPPMIPFIKCWLCSTWAASKRN